jgi:hypothetical protein
MPRTLTLTRYPLLKVSLPLGLLILLAGLVVFFTNANDAMMLLPFLVVAALVAFAGLLWRKREAVEMVLPTDRLHERSRKELQGILETLDASKAKGELTEERYQKARDRIVKEMKGRKA